MTRCLIVLMCLCATANAGGYSGLVASKPDYAALSSARPDYTALTDSEIPDAPLRDDTLSVVAPLAEPERATPPPAPPAPSKPTRHRSRDTVYGWSPTWCAACPTWKRMDTSRLPFDLVWNNQEAPGATANLTYPAFTVTGSDGQSNYWWGLTSLDGLERTWRNAQGTASATSAEAAPTPHAEVRYGLALLNLKPGMTLDDIGAGDGRVVIEAAKTYGIRATGIEIDPARAAGARRAAHDAGLSEVEIVEGDAREIDLHGDVAFVYLFPELLAELRPKLVKYDRVVSYMHAIPGLAMQKSGNFYVWNGKPPQPVAQQQQATRTSTYGLYNWHCGDRGCDMCNRNAAERRAYGMVL